MSARLVILASGSGTLLQSVIDAVDAGSLTAQIVAVGSDVSDCTALERATNAGIETFVVSPRDFADRAEWNSALTAMVASLHPDWIVSAGFMRILGEEFVDAFPNRIINTHPALLPSFPGAHAVRDALAAGATTTGCTVHFVDHGVDTGPVIAQATVEVLPDDDEASLHERIKEQERALLIETLSQLIGEK